MKAVIQRDDLARSVKVYIVEEIPNGRCAFLWPVEYEEFGWSWYRWEEDNTRDPQPALQMSVTMWDAFTKALLESQHVRVDALDIIARTLEREQARVDKLIDFAITPPTQIFATEGPA